MYLTKTFIVRAPIDRVYAYLSDPRNAVRPRAEGTLTVELVADGVIQSVRSYRASVTIPSGHTATYEMRFEDLEPPRRLAATIVGGMPGQMDMGSTRVTYDLASVDGGTRVVERGEFHPGLVKAGLMYFARITALWRRQSRPAGAAMAQAIETWAAAHPSPAEGETT